MKRVRNFIAGEFVDGERWFEKRSSVDNQILLEVAEAGPAQVNAAVQAAKAALHGEWGELSVEQRGDLLYGVADEIMRRFDDFVEAEVADTGQPIGIARGVNVPRSAGNFKLFVDVIKNISSESFQTDMRGPHGSIRALNYSLRSPVGVVAVISPWNMPMLLTTWKLGPAMACGNTVVVKPSEETPQSAALMGEVMNKVGIPKGVYNVVQGFGPDSAGELLTRHKDVAAITFTGETRTGQKIMEAAATGARPVSFEMGGKSPAIVFADCNLDEAIEGTMRSSFLNCGQVCLGTERIYVERPLYEEFLKRMIAGAEGLVIGDPRLPETTLGPLISREHQGKVLSYYRLAEREGAVVHTGGGVPEMPAALKKGAWVQPTVWTGLPPTSAILREEIFGPCCHIEPFDREEDVIRIANDTTYGLAASVWTNDLKRAHRVSAKLQVGLVWVNSWFLRDLRTPFGGAKESGVGREGGVHSLEFYTELKNVCIRL